MGTNEQSEEKDWLLEILVTMANSGLSIPVTLFVKGSVVTGDLISLKDYFSGIGKQFGAGAESNEASTFSHKMETMFEDLGVQLMAQNIQPSDANPADREEVFYLHIRNARFLSGDGQFVPNNHEGILWRGKISEIDGWILGSATSSRT